MYACRNWLHWHGSYFSREVIICLETDKLSNEHNLSFLNKSSSLSQVELLFTITISLYSFSAWLFVASLQGVAVWILCYLQRWLAACTSKNWFLYFCSKVVCSWSSSYLKNILMINKFYSYMVTYILWEFRPSTLESHWICSWLFIPHLICVQEIIL